MSCVGRGIVLRQMGRLFEDGTLTGLGDGQLLERYLTRRDEDAFAALVDLHGPMVLGLCRRMLRDPRDIEDAFQATFLVLVRKAPAIRDRNLLSNWLYGVAYRVARRARTRTLRRRDREAAVGTPEVAAGPDPADRPELDAMLDQELSRLPEKYRAPLVLCYLRGRTHDQAAEELRCPVGTVRSRMARGRDLLRDRLTRRGFAPTAMAAILGPDPMASARLLVATVPTPMAAATVRAALAFASAPILKAGATALALAQGVLTTMKLAQIKWIGLAALATSLSAGSVVAVAYAAASRQEAAKPVGRKTVTVPDSQEQVGSSGTPQTTEAHLKALEDKIDRLMNRIGPLNPDKMNPFDTPFAPAQGSEDDRQPVRTGQLPRTNSIPISELETRLKLGFDEYKQMEALHQMARVQYTAVEQARGKVLIAAAHVDGLDREYQEEMERLILEGRRKTAQGEKAQALEEVAGAVVSRNRRLNERKPGMVSPDDVTKAESELKAATADRKIAQIDIDEVELRVRQLDRRRERIKKLARLAEQVKKDMSQPTPAEPPAAVAVPTPPQR